MKSPEHTGANRLEIDYEIRSWQGENVLHVYPYTFNEVRREGEESIGKGSILGITNKLDWIEEMGVTAIWLGPIYESPGLDGNYDISDYRHINSDLGTMQDVEELIEKAHERNIRIIFDLVPNHTSDQHEWFQASRDPTHQDHDKYKDFYIWLDPVEGDLPEGIVGEDRLEGLPDGYTVPNNWSSVFSTPQIDKTKSQYGGEIPENVEVPAVTAWVWNKDRHQFYLAEFMKGQPSLSWNNPKVREAIKDVTRFWLDKGVDGFRVDVVNHIGKDPNFRDEVLAETGTGIYQYNKGVTNSHDRWKQEKLVSFWEKLELYVKDLISVADEYPDRNIRFILEDWISALTGDEKMDNINPEVATVFNFIQLLSTNRDHWSAPEHKRLIEHYVERMKHLAGGIPNQVTGNHDTDMVRTRLESKNAARTAQFIAGMLPGMWYVWQREVLGTPNIDMPDEYKKDKDIGGRDGERVLMTWNSRYGGGFSEGMIDQILDTIWIERGRDNSDDVRPDKDISWLNKIDIRYIENILEEYRKKFWLPPVDQNIAAQDNVELQMLDPKSPYWLTRDIMTMRKKDPVLKIADNLRMLNTDHENVLAFARQDPDNPHRQIIVIANFSAETTEVAILDAGQSRGRLVMSSLEGKLGGDEIIDIDGGKITLPPDGAYMIDITE